MILKEQNNQKKTLTDGVLDINHEQENTPSTNGKASPLARPFPARPPAVRAQGCRDGCRHVCHFPDVPRLSPRLPDEAVDGAFPQQRSSDGSLSHEEDLAKVIELQEIIDKQAREQSQMKERLAALSSHVTELEEDLDTARKDLIKSEEVNTKLQRDVREVSESRNCSGVIELTVWRVSVRLFCSFRP